MHEKEIQFVSFVSDADLNNKDLGFGELESIDRAINSSKSNIDYFFKCSGRVYIKNITKLKLNNYGIQCNFNRNLIYTNSVFFGCSYDIYKKYLYPKMLKNVINNNHIEQGLAMGIHNAILNGAKWSPIYPIPYIDGYSGTKGNHYMKRYPAPIRLLINLANYIHYKDSKTSYKDGRHYYDVTKGLLQNGQLKDLPKL